MADRTLLFLSDDPAWLGYDLRPAHGADSLFAAIGLSQFAADPTAPIDLPHPDRWALDEGVSIPPAATGLIVLADVEDEEVIVYQLVATVTRPFVTASTTELRFATQRRGEPELFAVSKADGDYLTIVDKLQSQQQRSTILLAGTSSDGQHTLVWFHPGGPAAWRDEAVRADAATKARRRNRELHDSCKAFINPYTFVPLREVTPGPPHGHRGDPDLLIGSVDLTYELLTDLVLPSDWSPDGDGPQTISLPGSGFRGAARSLHEVIAGGCMRVVDLDFTPVHRETTEDAKKAHQLAVVTAVDANAHVSRIRLTEEPIWVPFTDIESSTPLRSGLRFDLATPFTGERNPEHARRLERSGAITITADPDGDWVLHLSDTGARGAHPYWLPIARLTAEEVEISQETRLAFEKACLRAEGVDGALAPTAPPLGHPDWPGVDVYSRHARATVGQRRKVTGRLGQGDSVWWEPKEKRLKMAVMWRKSGTGSVQERMPDSQAPCSDPGSLCPTCAVFGAAGPNADSAEDRSAGSHRAYGGHARFLPTVTAAPVEPRQASLAPLREPRPGSGGFYLRHQFDKERLKGKRGLPKSYWGSALDNQDRREIAGRKFYWHGQQAGLPNTGAETPRQFQRNANIEDPARWLIPAGTRLVQRVTFDGIDDAQLALLISALDPQELTHIDGAPTPVGELALHLGGGKPLGFGSTRCVEKVVCAERAADRYSPSPATAPVDVSGSLNALLSPETPAPWFIALFHALDTEFVAADRIHYPFDPEKADFTRGPANESFLKAFEFFAHYNGGYERSEGQGIQKKILSYPMVPLPHAAELVQYLAPEPEQKDVPRR